MTTRFTKLMATLSLGLMVSAANAQTEPTRKSPVSPAGTCRTKSCPKTELTSRSPSSASEDRPKVASAKTTADLSADETRLIELTNAERRKAGLPPLKANATLMKLARNHSANMARLNLLGHTLDGVSFDQRLATSGYGSFGGENCAQGSRTPEDTIAMWMQSPGHQANLLGSGFQEIGVGLGTSSDGQRFWTQVFAASAHRNQNPSRDDFAASASPPAPPATPAKPKSNPIPSLAATPAAAAAACQANGTCPFARPATPAVAKSAQPQHSDPANQDLQRVNLNINVNSAIAELNESIHGDPENPEHQYVLAYLQRRAGQVDEAQKTVQTARALEQQRSVSNWGRLMERFQGPSRVWLEDARRK